MSSKTEDAKALSASVLSPEAVAEWLKSHPAFLNERPDVLAELTPPEKNLGDGVADMQRFMLDRLQRELHAMNAREKNLLAAAKANAESLTKIHQAACAALDADSLDDFVDDVVDRLPALFEIAAACFCVEETGTAPERNLPKKIVVLQPGTIAEIVKGDRAVALRADIEGDPRLFGDLATQIRSEALMKIEAGEGMPPVLLALGARARDGFDPRQGTELLSFLTRVIQHCVSRWLGDTA